MNHKKYALYNTSRSCVRQIIYKKIIAVIWHKEDSMIFGFKPDLKNIIIINAKLIFISTWSLKADAMKSAHI